MEPTLTPDGTPERLITARGLAEMLNVSAETVLRWTNRGDLPGFRIPGPTGVLRYRLSDVEAWLASRSTTRG